MNILEDFGGVNKHLFRKIYLITKAQSLLYIWHNSDSLKVYEKCATKGGGQNDCQKFARYNCIYMCNTAKKSCSV